MITSRFVKEKFIIIIMSTISFYWKWENNSKFVSTATGHTKLTRRNKTT